MSLTGQAILCTECAVCDECGKRPAPGESMWKCDGCPTFTCSPGCHYAHVQTGHWAIANGVPASVAFVDPPFGEHPYHDRPARAATSEGGSEGEGGGR